MAVIVRKLGMIERACSIRHDLGHYPCASISARYTFDAELKTESVLQNVKHALLDVVNSQPIMNCGIIGEDTAHPSFVRLESIDIPSCIEVYPEAEEYFKNSAAFNSILARRLEALHQTCFTQLDRYPGWKLLVTIQSKVSKISEMDALFVWHHGFFDGLSGVNFHRKFLRGLNKALDAVEETKDFVRTVPAHLDICPPLEKSMNFPVTWKYWLNQYWEHYVPNWMLALVPNHPHPKAWAGNKCQLSDKHAYRMRMRVSTFTEYEVSLLLVKCRQNQLSLTALMHGALVAAFATQAPEAESFLALTPLSLRNYTGNDKNEAMVNEFDDLWCTYDHMMIEAARKMRDTGFEDLTAAWNAGRVFKSSLKARRQQIPWDLELAFPDWADVRALHEGQLGKDRFVTFEMSNIGSIESNATKEKHRQQCSISNMVWSQSAMVTGPLLTVGAASVDNGPLAFTFAWQKGAMDDEFADSVISSFEDLLKRVMYGNGTVQAGKS